MDLRDPPGLRGHELTTGRSPLPPRGPHRRTARVQAEWLNGAPALWVEIDGKVDAAVSPGLGGGRITGSYAIRNPDKLTRLGEVVHLSRTC